MVLVDTSVWIRYFRGGDPMLVQKLHALLDEDRVALAAPVWIELLSGATKAERPILKRVLSALPRFYPERPEWDLVEKWTEKASSSGHRFGASDLLIAAIGANQDASVWSLDSDFQRMATLKMIGRFEP
jgi:predicted nucleic acid-binding protein